MNERKHRCQGASKKCNSKDCPFIFQESAHDFPFKCQKNYEIILYPSRTSANRYPLTAFYCFSAQSTIARKPASTSSSEAAIAMRTNPSPCAPKPEPGTNPTPASSRIRSQISSEVIFNGRKSRKK